MLHVGGPGEEKGGERGWQVGQRLQKANVGVPSCPRRAGCGVGVPTLTFAKSGAKRRLGGLTGAFFTRRRPKKRLGGFLGALVEMP